MTHGDTTSPSTPAAKPDAELMERASAWVTAAELYENSVHCGTEAERADRAKQCNAAELAFRTYAATLAAPKGDAGLCHICRLPLSGPGASICKRSPCARCDIKVKIFSLSQTG